MPIRVTRREPRQPSRLLKKRNIGAGTPAAHGHPPSPAAVVEVTATVTAWRRPAGGESHGRAADLDPGAPRVVGDPDLRPLPVEPGRIQALLPEGLTVDVYDGAAWLGLTPFVMANMRPLGVPDLPGDWRLVPGLRRSPRVADLSSSPETNLRTYVRGPDGRDGLWFFSLDIGSAALADAIRTIVGAPYHNGHLSVEDHDDGTTWRCG